MYRYAEKHLKAWLERPSRKPLIIRGARQVGKSTLVRRFSKSQQLVLCEINLEQHLELEGIFKTLDTELILKELSAILKRSPLQKNHVLFLDEVQATPAALTCLRYFYELHPELIVITAGSLLDFALREHQYSMPVGRIEYFHLGPMTFKEFLLAKQEDYLVELIDNFRIEQVIPQQAHQQFQQQQREYVFVGGMPEAIQAYLETDSLLESSRAHEAILATLKDDFNKYCNNANELLRLQNLLQQIPAQVGQKIKYSKLAPNDRSRETKHALELLVLARICTQVFHTDCSGLPLGAQINHDLFKCLFVDVGLMNRALGLDWTAIHSRDEQTLINEGGLTEQLIGQHLLYHEHGLFEPTLNYWVREGRSSNAEVDYIISSGDWIIPVEIKAGQSGSLRSLHQYIYARHPKLAVRFDMNLPSLTTFKNTVRAGQTIHDIQYNLLSLPLYLVEALPKLVTTYREHS